MKTYLDCFPCFVNQALRAGRLATTNKKKIKKLLDEVGMMLKDIPLENTPPETGALIYKKIRKITGNPDPFKKIKHIYTEKALSLYPLLKEKVKNSTDSLLTAIRFAIAGNIIDFGVNQHIDLEKEINSVIKKDFAIFHYQEFKEHLKRSKSILYIGDNAGETVFDRILIEELKKTVIFVVRDIPVINDATYSDAVQAQINEVAKIIPAGSGAPGLILNKCSNKFIKIFNNADMIISKGQGNYEGLSDEKKTIFFLLKVKCPVIARNIGVDVGDIILKGISI